VGAWDGFSTRNIGLRVNRRMATGFGGNMARFQNASATSLAEILTTRIPADHMSRKSFENFAMIAALIPELRFWSTLEKKDLLRIIRAKSGAEEMRYLHLLQAHGRLRDAMLRVGSEV